MPDRELLTDVAPGEDLLPGARNVVRVCLAAQPGESVVLIADERSAEIAAAILVALDAAETRSRVFLVERHGRRPLPSLPAAIATALAGASASLLTIGPEPGELEVRAAVVELACRYGLRHAHMPGIDRYAMVTGMLADYLRVARLQQYLVTRFEGARTISVHTEAGTDLEVSLDPRHEWIRNDGIIRPGRCQNLPTGLLQTTPASAEGTYVADGAIGDWFGTRYNDLASHPVTVELSEGRVRTARCDRESLARQLLLYVRSNANGDRVGELGIGTNLALARYTGNVLHDQNVPGALITLGGTAVLAGSGASWSARTHVPLVARECDVEVDGEPILERGHFLDDLLEC